MSIYNIASLFCGCGGMDFGIQGGFNFLGIEYATLPGKIIYAIDNNDSALKIYKNNLHHPPVCKDIREEPSVNIPSHDILIGGFPCTSFSVVAQNPKRLGYKSKDGQLFFEMCRILKQKQPRVFVAENVTGLLSANNGEAFPLIVKEFKNCGYTLNIQILNAAHYGVPQKRQRVFIVGFLDSESAAKFHFPNPTTYDIHIPLSVVLQNEENIEETYYFSSRAVEGLKKSKSGRMMNKGRSQDINLPCNTVGSHLAKVSLNSTDPVLESNGRFRMFTPREVARIQSFPDEFKLHSTKTINYRALGNAVAPVVMWHVSKNIFQTLMGQELPEYTGPNNKRISACVY